MLSQRGRSEDAAWTQRGRSVAIVDRDCFAWFAVGEPSKGFRLQQHQSPIILLGASVTLKLVTESPFPRSPSAVKLLIISPPIRRTNQSLMVGRQNWWFVGSSRRDEVAAITSLHRSELPSRHRKIQSSLRSVLQRFGPQPRWKMEASVLGRAVAFDTIAANNGDHLARPVWH